MKHVRASVGLFILAVFALAPRAAAAAAAPPDTVTGHVSASATGEPLAGVTLWAVDGNSIAVGQAVTDVNGDYSLSPQAPGTYYLFTYNDQGYVDELFDNLACAGNCGLGGGTPVIITPGVSRTGVDFALDAGASFTGTMTDETTGAAIAEASVYVLDAAGQVVSRSITRSDGTYRTTGLPAGGYRALTANSVGYAEELYDNVVCIAGTCNLINPTAAIISLTGTAITPGIDFTLARAGQIAGTVGRSDTGLPIGNVEIRVFDITGLPVTTAVTSFDGRFATTGLMPGTYFLRTVNWQGLKDQHYSGQSCVAEQCPTTSGTGVAVFGGTTSANIDFLLDPGAAVTGIVTDLETGLPVSNVEIAVYNNSGVRLASTRTDAAGVFMTTGFQGGTYYAGTRGLVSYLEQIYNGVPCLPGLCSATNGTPLVLADPGVRPGVNFALARGGSISGRVTDPAGGGVAGVGVEVWVKPAPANPIVEFVQRGTTDATGAYTVAGIPAGNVYVAAYNTVGYLNKLYDNVPCMNRCYPGNGNLVPVVNGVTTPDINFVLPREGRIGGRVTDATTGTGVVSVNVQIYTLASAILPGGPAPPPPPSLQFVMGAFTDATGAYDIGGLPAGTYYARTTLAGAYINQAYDNLQCGFTCGQVTGTPIVVSEGGTSTADFALVLGGRVSGHITDAQSSSDLPGVFVLLYSAGGTFVTSTRTNAAGVYTLEGLPGGQYFAATSAPSTYVNQIYSGISCLSFCQPGPGGGTAIFVTAGVTTANVNFALTLAGPITGVVTDAITAAPLRNVQVQLYNSAGSFIASTSTDVSGAYAFQGLPAATYYARTSNFFGYFDRLYNNIPCSNCQVTLGTAIITTAGSTSGSINFALTPGGTITGIVRDGPTGLPRSGVFVQIFNAATGFTTGGVTDPTGRYTVSGLASGTYRASAGVIGYLTQLYNNISCVSCSIGNGTPFAVVAGATTGNIDFTLQLAGRITGRVTNQSTGAGVAGVFVQVFAAPAGVQVAGAFTDPLGNYTAGGLIGGTYYARTFNAPGLFDKLYNNISCESGCTVTSGTSIPVVTGAATPNIDFALAQAPRVSGRITSAGSGAGLPGVLVSIYNDSGGFVTTTSSDGSGNYGSSTLKPGTYYAKTGNAVGFLDQLYQAKPCTPSCSVTTGTPISVQPGLATPGINFALAPSARISGTVRTAAANVAIVSALIEVDDANGAVVTRILTDASGNYTAATNLRTGSYHVRTRTSRFVDEVFDDVICLSCDVTTAGTRLDVTEGVSRANVDFRLETGGAISGRVTAAPGASGLAGINVQVFDSGGTLVMAATTDGFGNYATAPGLPSGQYFARTSNTFQGYKDVLYDARPCVFSGCTATTGTPIAVTAGATTSAINFGLSPLGRISGVIRDSATATALTGARVQVYNSSGLLVANGFQSGAIGYAVGGLAPGTYYVVASRAGYRQQIYDQVPFTCIVDCIVSGTPVVLSDGGAVTGIDFALQAGGRIAGHIADGVTRASLSNITAEIYDSAQVLVSRASTDGSGNYVSDAGLPDGNYYLRTRNNRGYIDRLYPAVECGTCSLTFGSPISVTGGLTTANINLDLLTGGRIFGTVTSNGRGVTAAIQTGSFSPSFAGNYFDDAGAFVTRVPTDASGNYSGDTFVTVNVFDDAGQYVTRGTADASGNYVTQAGLPDGFYRAVTANSAGLSNQMYDGVLCPLGCDPLAGTALLISTGRGANASFDLARGGRIAGVVTDAATGLPLRGVWVDIYDAANQFVATGRSTNSGAYATFQGLATGTYYARTRDLPSYRSERYNDLICPPSSCLPSGGSAIVVTSSSTTAGIDFALTTGSPVQVPIITWAAPADITYPTALSGAQLNATANVPGTLAYSPDFGSTPSVGNGQVLSVIFTPSDTVNYSPATASVAINVLAGPPVVSVVSPNGGEKVFIGVPVTTRWTVSGGGTPSAIDVAVSTNGGSTFLDIAGCTGLPGTATSCSWTPVTTTTTARIRVTAHSAAADVSDTSDADFRIAAGPPAVTLTAPNTAVAWAVGTTNLIKWSHNLGLDNSVSIELSRDGGTTWEVLAASVPNTAAASGSWPWLVTGPATTTALVRVSSIDTPATATSAVAFSIVAPAVTVTSPNTLVTWKSGTIRNVTFGHNLGVGATVELEISRDAGATWAALATVTATSATTGKYAWTVTTPQTTNALVRATWAGHSGVADVSDVEFTITPAITVTAPKTAVTWGAGSIRQITWTHNLDAGATVDIDASGDGGASWSRLASAVSNATASTGSWSGPMPPTPTAQAVIRVSQTGVASEYDTSVVFTLATPALSVTAPRSNAKWAIGAGKTIRWTHNLGTGESVKTELSRDGGATWDLLSASVPNSGNTTGTFDWTVSGPATASAVVRVTWSGGTGVTGVSATFRIQ